MDYANYWASAVATADLGDTIDQSVRFDGGSNFSRTFGTPTDQNKWTYSCWIKRGDIGSAMTVGLSTQAASYGEEANLEFNAGGNLLCFGSSNGSSWTTYLQSNQVFRDPSAWYHLMAVLDTDQASSDDRWKWYVNGTQITSFSSNTRSGQSTNHYTNSAQSHTIGSRAGGGMQFHGQMAMVIFVDGQALGPTDLGKSNDDGVWVPVDYSGTYGNNGFKLTFDSTQANGIGHDSSGNGNNFTASGFDTADVALYSASEAGSGTTYESNSTNRTATLINSGSAFDGDTAGGTQVSMTGGGYWYLTHTISNVTGLRIMVKNDTSEIADTRVNGSTVTTTVDGDYIVVSSPPSTVTEVAIRRNQANTQVYQVEVNTGSGFTALLDNTDNDVDYFDTPTSNYGTWNPLHTAEGNKGAFTDANLQTANNSGGDYIAPSTIACGDGHWYWEVRVDGVQTTGYPMIGIFDYESAKPEWGGGTSNTEGCLYWTTGEFGAFVTQGSQSSYGTSFTTGDIIGVEYNGSNGKLTFYKNGTSQGLATTVVTSRRENMIPGVSAGNNGSAEVSVNFGQMNFIYTMPTGAEKLQTNKLAEPTIKNGKDHFDVLTWTGDGASPKTRTGLEFTPDLIWIKDRNNNFSIGHRLYDSVRGAGVNKHLDSSTNKVEGDGNDADYGYVTGFVDGGFTAQAGSLGDDYVNDTSTNYVAWCWKCDESFTPTVTGVSSASGKRNTTAGFSILTYTGNNSSGTITHGLNSAPEFILFKRRSIADNWVVYHASAGATQALSLDGSGQAFSSTFLSNTAPSASTITLGGVSGANGTGTFVAYCWHSVEGYSKFGGYNGGGSGSAPDYDGPFIHLGFKPSWLLIKRSNAAGDPWILLDSTRDTHNFAFQALQPDNSNTEVSSGDQFAIDFLSNGFKCRSSNAAINNSSATYVYAAFAENPFGGENAPPATGR